MILILVVLVALPIGATLFAGVVDYGQVVLARQELARRADAAALAGAGALWDVETPEEPNVAGGRRAATEFATENPCGACAAVDDEIQIVGRRVEVTARATVSSFLLGPLPVAAVGAAALPEPVGEERPRPRLVAVP